MSILISMDLEFAKPLYSELQALEPHRHIQVWPQVSYPEEIRYALLWT